MSDMIVFGEPVLLLPDITVREAAVRDAAMPRPVQGGTYLYCPGSCGWKSRRRRRLTRYRRHWFRQHA